MKYQSFFLPVLLKAGLKWDEWDNCNNKVRARRPKTGLQNHEKIIYNKLAFNSKINNSVIQAENCVLRGTWDGLSYSIMNTVQLVLGRGENYSGKIYCSKK